MESVRANGLATQMTQIDVSILTQWINANQAEQVMRQAFNALETAGGCLMLVADDRKPIDLEECRVEIEAARMTLYRALGFDNG